MVEHRLDVVARLDELQAIARREQTAVTNAQERHANAVEEHNRAQQALAEIEHYVAYQFARHQQETPDEWAAKVKAAADRVEIAQRRAGDTKAAYDNARERQEAAGALYSNCRNWALDHNLAKGTHR